MPTLPVDTLVQCPGVPRSTVDDRCDEGAAPAAVPTAAVVPASAVQRAAVRARAARAGLRVTRSSRCWLGGPTLPRTPSIGHGPDGWFGPAGPYPGAMSEGT